MNQRSHDKGWDDPHAVTLRDILVNAKGLIEQQEFSVRDAIYASAVNGESDSAAMLALERAGLQFGVGKAADVLEVFEKAITDLAP